MIFIDPVEIAKTFLEADPEIPEDSVTGDLNTREAEDTTIYLEDTLLIRQTRDCEDRADVEYEVYHVDRGEAKRLAHLCRRKFLEEMPGLVIGSAEILDTDEVTGPEYQPDINSREHVYVGEFTLWYVEA